ncbi:DEKNAAC102504 [Brettanomyces naardenensis]|uniref:DEKNAAC102504 n=1 Tax=Brettanomyces naardenensis TaxID=13370 RepID=A0A448YKJ9_BRENA|nr:DEKNAAC102504 [Brettanomyces naardenensis]
MTDKNISSFNWRNITLELPQKGENVKLLSNVSGFACSGEIMAIMGPSGSGKTTLLNVLAQRNGFLPGGYNLSGTVFTDAFEVNPSNVQLFSSYVEQEDSLIGSLTVRETVDYSCRLSDAAVAEFERKHKNVNDKESQLAPRDERVRNLLEMVGLQNQLDTLVGTHLQKGISGGQKRRLSVASQLINSPSVLFLDEPTSGLDSTASHYVVKVIKEIARTYNMIILISIHQPSTSTFQLFDKVLFLSKGKTIYNGYLTKLNDYFAGIGKTIPNYYNPAEYVLEMINTDFTKRIDAGDEVEEERLEEIGTICSSVDCLNEKWESSSLKEEPDSPDFESKRQHILGITKNRCCQFKFNLQQTLILVKRLAIKSRRDVLAYYVRIIMYLGLAILMGTVWLRLNSNQDKIQPITNAIFFSGAFMSFMSVAYIPAYIEDYQTYRKEHMNGLYGPFAFVVSNFIIGLPFIFVIAILFSVITYFMCNFRHSATAFWYYVMWLFLDLVAAESMTVFVCTVFPVFVVALAITAFLNGLWMAVGGFLVSSNILNVFWYYTFYWIDYQRYVFQGMMFNEFTGGRAFNCGSSCHCMYSSPLEDQCKIEGTAVLKQMGYGSNETGMWVGIMIAIIFAYRLGSYLVLKFWRKS